ncbi:transposase [Lactobacillus helveticus R0052]|nr:transposase [Lactobacillus helveticus R0052]
MKKHKIYEAELIQPACPYCGSLALLHNGHLITNIRYLTANASHPVTIRLAKQRVRCRDCKWSNQNWQASTVLFLMPLS